MNHFYGLIRPGEIFNWCGRAGCGAESDLALTLSLAAGGFALTAILAVLVVFRKKDRPEEVLALSDSGKRVELM